MTAAARSSAQPKGWLATLLVLVIMLGIVAGGFFAAEAVAGLPDQPIEVGHGVSVVVPPDWEFGGRIEQETVLLSRGNASLAIIVEEGTDETAALASLRAEWLATGRVSASEIAPVDDAGGGRPAARFAYSGTFGQVASPVEGEVTGVRGTGITVLFDAWAGFGDFVKVRPEIAGLIAGTTIP